MEINKSFCCGYILSNDVIISVLFCCVLWPATSRSENGYGFWRPGLKTGVVWNRVKIWRTGRHTPNKNSQEYPPGENYTCKSFLNKLTPGVSCPDKLHRCSSLIFVTDVSRQFHPIVIHLRLAINVWREQSLTMTELPLSAINGKRLLWLLENGLITQHWAWSYKTMNFLIRLWS